MKCIFIDLDGTLLPHNESSIPPLNKEALFKAHQNGHKLILSTGRSFADLNDEILSLPFDYYVVAAGAAIFDKDLNLLFTCHFPKESISEIATFLKNNSVGFTLEGIFKNYYEGEDTIATFNALNRQIEKQKNYEKLKEIVDQAYLKFSLYSKEKENINAVIDHFKERFNATLNPSLKNYYNGEITMKSISKQTAMKYILNILDIDQKDTIAIGDSNNDYTALEYANIKIAMGNASEKLKAIATFITSDEHDHGLYKAFKHIDLF